MLHEKSCEKYILCYNLSLWIFILPALITTKRKLGKTTGKLQRAEKKQPKQNGEQNKILSRGARKAISCQLEIQGGWET